MNINLITAKYHSTSAHKNINFKGDNFTEHVNGKKLIHDTSFFREFDTDDFVKDYLQKEFLSKGEPVNIVVGACSVGNEVYTQAMLYDEYSDKVNILGFDLGPESIKRAQRGRFIIQGLRSQDDSCIWKDAYLAGSARTNRQKRNAELFNKYFEIENDEKAFPMEDRYLYRGNLSFEKIYKLKEGMGKNCSFTTGDITKLDEIMPNNSTHCLFFRNALYHLVCEGGNRYLKPNDEEIIRNIALQAREKLVDGGLFVFGESEEDQGVNVKNVYKIMKECGFEPFNTDHRMSKKAYFSYDYSLERNTNVWRKVG